MQSLMVFNWNVGEALARFWNICLMAKRQGHVLNFWRFWKSEFPSRKFWVFDFEQIKFSNIGENINSLFAGFTTIEFGHAKGFSSSTYFLWIVVRFPWAIILSYFPVISYLHTRISQFQPTNDHICQNLINTLVENIQSENAWPSKSLLETDFSRNH